MSNINTEGLPPEMQARIAQIIEGAKARVTEAQAPAQPPAPASTKPEVRPPSLMDHAIAMRQEIQALRQETAGLSQQLNAVAQVVDACGQAVGQLYATFQQTTAPTDQGATYSSQFQQPVGEEFTDF